MSWLAILSPSKDAYSETFIHAHRQLPFPIKFYYGGFLPRHLEGRDGQLEYTFLERVKRKFFKRVELPEYALRSSFRQQNIGCVLAEYGPTASHSLKVIKSLGLALVVHFHGYDASVVDVLDTYAAKYRAVFGYASAVVVVSKKMREKIIGLGCPPEKILLTTYGPNPTFFANKPAYLSRQFIAVGRFVEKKAPHLTILAFKKVLERFADAELVMVGDGSLLPFCQDMVNGLGIGDNVTFLGAQSHENIRKLFEQSLAFVQHSVVAVNGDSEGTPVAIIEAQAAALPVVATYHAGIPDVVLHNETGFLVHERDLAAMADYMCRLIEQPRLAVEIGLTARKRVSDFFTMERHLLDLQNVISPLLKN